MRLSRPDHHAAVTGRFEPYRVHVWPGDPSSLVVDQEGWKLLETRGPEEWVAAYRIKTSPAAWSAPWLIKRTGETWSAERLPQAP